MANSSIIGKVKRQLVKDIIKDETLVKAIDSPNVTSPQKLINTHIFTYNQNPFTINKDITFLTILVHEPDSFTRNDDGSDKFIDVEIEIWIISHHSHMEVNNIPKITDNRNDYLSELLDLKLNGRTDLGIGEVKLIYNIEGSFQKDYLYRKMLFKTKDLNNSLCKDE